MLTSAAQLGSHAFEMINVHLSKTLGTEPLICLSYNLKIQGFSESTPADWKLRLPLAPASTPVSGDGGFLTRRLDSTASLLYFPLRYNFYTFYWTQGPSMLLNFKLSEYRLLSN